MSIQFSPVIAARAPGDSGRPSGPTVVLAKDSRVTGRSFGLHSHEHTVLLGDGPSVGARGHLGYVS